MQANVIYTRIPSCDQALVEEAGKFGVADLHEALDLVTGRMALMHHAIRPLNGGLRISGQAVTAFNYPADGLFLHKAVQLVKPGQILVIANSGNAPSTMFAELVALAALKNGAVGVIADGSIRDTDALREMKFPIWSASIHAGHVEKRGPGAVNIPVVCGGALVEPGDIIVADHDGVICIPRSRLEATVAGARERAAREVVIRERIDNGETLFDILDLQTSVDRAGAVQHDSTWNGEA
ncbi:MAG TPA: 4-carboxy-4-hydroxy-2-oxoadipate aldolase/oxaloacetate decarboxylase [Rhizobiaceae bacterium]|nr:4-carboxy-4-hydroxy-2-oxoadipate aldolase/oxaloacetate decarboxylase [Rhizobiaceae bacterium]